MTAPIALLQFRTNPNVRVDERKNVEEKLGGLAEIVAFNALQQDCARLSLDQYSGFIFGGSGELFFSEGGRLVERARQHTSPLIRELVRTDTPSLFICLGLHLLADTYNVSFYKKGAYKEIGTIPVTLTDNAMRDPLFDGMPKTFTAQTGHYDAVQHIPHDARLLARNSNCSVQGFRMKNHVYALQFHPEMNSADVHARLRYYPAYDPKGAKFEESPETAKIMRNFVLLAHAHYENAVTGALLRAREF